MNETAIAHWHSIAREWRYFGSPLRPCDEDTRFMSKIIAKQFEGKRDLKALLCGVTPEIACMPWPSGALLTAVERAGDMIQEVWPGDMPGIRKVQQGDWLEFETDEAAFDVVIGDGCFISMKYPEGYRALAARISRLLKKDGLLIMRFFTQSEIKESPDQVFDQLSKGKIGSFHAFKWRLAMSLHESPDNGVCLHDIYTGWLRGDVKEQALMAKTGWPAEALHTINLYENKQNSFAFAPLAETVAILKEFFSIQATYIPTYELGERCPILVLKR